MLAYLYYYTYDSPDRVSDNPTKGVACVSYRRTHSIFDYTPDSNHDDDDDLIKVTLSNGEVLFARKGIWKDHWALDPDLLPSKLSVLVRSLESVALKIRSCTVGEPIVVKAVGQPSYLFCVLTSTGTITTLRPVKRPNKCTPARFDYTLSSD